MTQPGAPAPDVCVLCRRTIALADREPIDGLVMCPLVQLPENAPYRPQTQAGLLAVADATGVAADVVPDAEESSPGTVLAFVDVRWRVAEQGFRKAALQLFILGGIVTSLALLIASVITAATAACVVVMVAEDRLGHAAWSAGATITGTGALMVIRSLAGRRGKRNRTDA